MIHGLNNFAVPGYKCVNTFKKKDDQRNCDISIPTLTKTSFFMLFSLYSGLFINGFTVPHMQAEIKQKERRKKR
ncbi:MAG: hypothetical protein C4541_07325 [Candidatus Auribacter fodinae]|uniref:Uncharacterized protein n=1 Tax=Candidatus Auribacter fodinae TaxID=2093366 RepID=A0A3A4R2I0_9BACT|nr:MAG: hypothetical protein C4541_07325 [Candidatus Auribacter fodinae]